MNYGKWWMRVYWLVAFDVTLGVAQIVIDRQSPLALLGAYYEPHALAARLIALPRAVLAVALIVILGVMLIRWAVERMARSA